MWIVELSDSLPGSASWFFRFEALGVGLIAGLIAGLVSWFLGFWAPLLLVGLIAHWTGFRKGRNRTRRGLRMAFWASGRQKYP